MIQQILVTLIGIGVFGYALYKTYLILKNTTTRGEGCGCKQCHSKHRK